MPRVGNKRKKRHTEKKVDVAESEIQNTPKCFVVKRGKLGRRLRSLMMNFRQVMSPNCAAKLRESRLNRVEDYKAVAGPMHVSHIFVFTATKTNSYLKLIKLPQGPTLTFRIDSFSNANDIAEFQKRARMGLRDFTVAPLEVLNGFGGKAAADEKATPKQLVAEMLRGIFPAVDVPNFNHAEVRRTALFHYDAESDLVHFRHYTVGRQVVGVGRGVKKLMTTSRASKLKLNGKDDIADLVLGGGAVTSDSEVEATQEVPLVSGEKVGVRLTEIGPRLALQLIKIEEGICTGLVLYHRYQTKTMSQQEVLEQKARERKKLKARNDKLDQLANAKKGKKKVLKDKTKKALEKQQDAQEEAGSADEDGGGKKKTQSATGGRPADGEAAGQQKRKRFHPLYRKDKKKSGREGAGGEQPSNDKSGGQGDNPGKGAGKGKAKQRVLDRFHQAAKKQRTS